MLYTESLSVRTVLKVTPVLSGTTGQQLLDDLCEATDGYSGSDLRRAAEEVKRKLFRSAVNR
jgi:hypothetical protein